MRIDTKLHFIIYSIICAVGLMPMFSSCSESDDKTSDDKQLTESLLMVKQVNAIQNVLTSLADIERLDDDFYQKTYAPTYGKVLDESNPFVRAIKADNKENAYQEFVGMVGDKNLLTPTSDGYSVELKLPSELAKLANKDLFGKLTYHQGNGSSRTAYVDVEIPNMPKLQRIDFVPSQLWGDNDDLPPTPYLLGQLVYYEGEWLNKATRGRGYWLCVREYTGDKPGLLVHVNEGYDKDFARYLYYESDWSWAGYFYTRADESAPYINFLNLYPDQVKKVLSFLKKYGNKSTVEGIVPPRFLENDSVYVGDKPAWIIHDTYESEWDSSVSRHWKCCKHYYLAPKNKYGEGQYEEWWYHSPSDWSNEQGKYYYYTINTIRFKSAVPEKTRLVYDPS